MNAATVLYYVAIFLWLAYLPVALIFLRGYVRNRKRYVNTNLARIHNDPFIAFQIMTRSARVSDVVERGIESIRSSCRDISYENYSITVVSDDPEDASYTKGAEVLVVPGEYKTKNGAIRKARALQYANDVRRSRGEAGKNRWNFHMDEESAVTAQTVLSLLACIREGKGLVSEGPIAYPFKMRQSARLAFLTDSIRPFQCYDCVSYMTNPPPMYMHGSNLLVRSDVEDRVGWDHGKSLAEDQLFGVKVFEMFGNVFGWHGGVLLEQPPLTLGDHFKQRRRWIFGTLQNLRYLPFRMKLRIYLRSATTWLGFLSAIASTCLGIDYFLSYGVPYFFGFLQFVRDPVGGAASLFAEVSLLGHFASVPPGQITNLTAGLVTLAFGASLMLASVIWTVSYQVGLKHNLRFGKYTSGQKFALHLEQLILGPVIGVIETLPSLYAIIQFHVLREKFSYFDLIAK